MQSFWLEWLSKHRRASLVVLHALVVAGAYLLAFGLRFDFVLTPREWRPLLTTLPLLLAIRLVAFEVFRLHRGVLRHAGLNDLLDILAASAAGSAIFAPAVLLWGVPGYPRSVLLAEFILCVGGMGGTRVAVRLAHELVAHQPSAGRTPALIVGAGDAGQMLAREVLQNPRLDYRLAGFVDDDPAKRGARLNGLPVLGHIEELPRICADYTVEEILIAIPSAKGKLLRRIIDACERSRVSFKTVPALDELLQGRRGIGEVRQLRLEDLLGHEPAQLDEPLLRREVSGARVLITGAGGSVGSELARQVARFIPGRLILLDRQENSLYFLEEELRRLYPHLRLAAVVGDVQDLAFLDCVFPEASPQVVYHAAAYKHVPLMEAWPVAAVANNVLATMRVAEACVAHGVRKCVLVSTDKAVHPTSVMGMTKRLAEQVVQGMNHGGGTTFVVVRFGNVLGSDGSVVPLFQRQIAAGGPVRVTHPEVTRYFMLPSEAAQLVLQAGAMGGPGDIFVLDMGEPHKILDLARNLIRLSGLEPDSDIRIEITGLRPGEKLHEELVAEGEELRETAHPRVRRIKPNGSPPTRFARDLEELIGLAARWDVSRTVEKLKQLVAAYA